MTAFNEGYTVTSGDSSLTRLAGNHGVSREPLSVVQEPVELHCSRAYLTESVHREPDTAVQQVHVQGTSVYVL